MKKPPRRALVVDDEPLIRWSVAATLMELGLQVEQADDSASTLEAIESSADGFDVVVLDLRLPDVDDLTLVAAIRRLMPASAVVLMTAFGSPEIVADAMALGVHTVLNKPFELAELAPLVLGPS